MFKIKKIENIQTLSIYVHERLVILNSYCLFFNKETHD